MWQLTFLLSLALCMLPILGNVEKTIFIGPDPIDHQPFQQHPNLEALRLETLNPSRFSLRRTLYPAKPGSLIGNEAWFLLDQLKREQRYEVRICWLATVS